MNKSFSKRLDAKRAELEAKRAQLDEVNATITRVLTGAQSWETRDGNASRKVTNASLSELNDAKRDLEKRIAELEAFVEGWSCDAARIGRIL